MAGAKSYDGRSATRATGTASTPKGSGGGGKGKSTSGKPAPGLLGGRNGGSLRPVGKTAYDVQK